MAAVSSSTSNSLALSGLASGINWTNIINDMAEAESAPITRWQGQQATITTQTTAYKTIGTDLAALQNDATTLSSADFFESATTSSSDPTVASATAQSGAPLGNYSFSVSQLASAATQNGSVVSAQSISSTTDVGSVTLNDSAFATPISAGTFTVNGQTITVGAADTLESVFTQIDAAGVTASYDPTADKITLASASPITLGSSADTSNFLQATSLYSNGGDSVTSFNALAGININVPAGQANLSTAVTDGGSGAGAFEINGVTIDYDSSTQSINNILQSINTSEAGVTASYDGANHRFVLTNNSTGNLGMTLQDVTGNFLAATGLSSGTLQAGSNLQYSLNNSSTMTSESNTIDASSLGLNGLSITAQSTGTTSIGVSSDTNTISTAITNFVNDYNTVQNYIKSQTTVSTTTDSTTGVSTTAPGALMGDMDVEGIATNLRQLMDATPLSGAVQNLNSIGISSNGKDNTLDSLAPILNDALMNNLSQVSELFSDPTHGLAATVGSYINDTLASNGILSTKEQSLSTQTTALSTSITNLQTKITGDEAEMQNQFVKMEDAINSINVEKQYLTAYFDSPTTSTDAPTAASGSSSSSSG